MVKQPTFLIKFAQSIEKKIQRLGIPLYSSKYSRKDYTQHQHILLLALRQKFHGPGYRRFIKEILPDLTAYCEYIGLEKIPHFTTLQKAAARYGRHKIELLVLEFLGCRRFKTIHLGVDASGFSLTHASHHYIRKLMRPPPRKKRGPGRPRKRRKVRRFLHTTLIVELRRTQFVAAVTLRRGPKNDSPLFIPTAKKVRLPQQISAVEADRGYDAETNLAWVAENWDAEPKFDLRNRDVPVHRTEGWHRKKRKRRLRKPGRKPKKHRNKNETVFSVIKRCFGEGILARRVKMQNIELVYKLLAYNARREILFLFIEGFYGAALPKSF